MSRLTHGLHVLIVVVTEVNLTLDSANLRCSPLILAVLHRDYSRGYYSPY